MSDKIYKIIVGVVLLAYAGAIGYSIHEAAKPVLSPVQLGAISYTPVEGIPYVIAKTVLPADNTITLSSFNTPDGRALTMADFGYIGYGTLDPTNLSRIESVTFNTITDNTNGTVTLGGVTRGNDFISPYAASTTLAQTHLVGSTFILSNTAGFYGNEFLFANSQSTSSVGLALSSTSPPYFATGPGVQANGTYISTTSELASVAYVNAVTTSGCSNANTTTRGCIQLATGAQAASSTSLGSTGAALVIPASSATDTPSSPQTVSASHAIFTDLTGYIKQGFINLTQQFNFSSLFATNASSTNATTTNETVTGNLIAGSASFSGTVSGVSGVSATNFEAAATTSIGQAVYSGVGAVDTGILVSNFGAGSGSSNSVSAGTGVNRVLVVVVNDTTSGDSASAVSYGGSFMTEIDNDTSNSACNGSNAGDCNSWLLVNPASGSNTLSITVNAGTAYFYYSALANAKQSGQPEAHTAATCESGGLGSVTTVANGALVVSARTSTSTLTGNQGAWENNANNSTNIVGGDSGLVYPASTAISIGGSNPEGKCFLLSIAPFSPVVQGVLPASSNVSTATSRSQFINSYTTFLGFALNSANFGQPITVQTDGILSTTTTLSSLPVPYYLNDTVGSIGTTPGTNTRKVGIEASTSAIVITNIW